VRISDEAVASILAPIKNRPPTVVRCVALISLCFALRRLQLLDLQCNLIGVSYYDCWTLYSQLLVV
jgi:hypothetical protein